MKKQAYFPPEAEELVVRMEENILISNQSFNEDDSDDDFFGDGED